MSEIYPGPVPEFTAGILKKINEYENQWVVSLNGFDYIKYMGNKLFPIHHPKTARVVSTTTDINEWHRSVEAYIKECIENDQHS